LIPKLLQLCFFHFATLPPQAVGDDGRAFERIVKRSGGMSPSSVTVDAEIPRLSPEIPGEDRNWQDCLDFSLAMTHYPTGFEEKKMVGMRGFEPPTF